ncbi:hydrogenase 4 subunit F [Candidatus Falkowbacteria bacterium]|nr:hydrogenase 4 subunit F [Candidatus Falkowbacteria bacterium]
MELLFIIASFIGTALIIVLIKNRLVIELLSIGASFVAFISSVFIALKVSVFGIYTPLVFLSVDSLGSIIMLIIGLICLATTIYSVEYLRQETSKNIIGFTRVKQYFILLNLFLMSMFLAASANNPIFAWIFIEATTLSTAFLISFYNKPSSLEAAWKYLIINSIGLLLGFLGTLLYFTTTTNLGGNDFVSWQFLQDNAHNFDPMVAKIAFIFVLIGYGTKVGLVPMHTWKPDAYSKAPAPIGALLSGALLPVAFAVILKLKVITDIAVGPLFSHNLLIFFGVLSIAVAALIMFNAKNYKRLLAYSSIENAGVMAFGFGLGGLGVFAATLHMIYHSFVKVVLFLSSGNLLLRYNSDKIKNVKGALSVVPVTSVLFISGFLIVTGTPPFGIFLTKMQILSVGINTHPVASIIALFFMAIVFIGFLKHVTSMFFEEKQVDIEISDKHIWLIIPPLIFLVLVFGLSFYIPPFLYTLISDVAVKY